MKTSIFISEHPNVLLVHAVVPNQPDVVFKIVGAHSPDRRAAYDLTVKTYRESCRQNGWSFQYTTYDERGNELSREEIAAKVPRRRAPAKRVAPKKKAVAK